MIGIFNILAALGPRTRLDVLNTLSRGPADGQTSGDLAFQARVPANSMSTHLSILAAAGPVTSTRCGRKTVYRIETMPIESALGMLSARLIDEQVPNRFSAGSSVTAIPPVADPDRKSQRALRGPVSARCRCTVVIREMVGGRAGDDHRGAACLPVQIYGG